MVYPKNRKSPITKRTTEEFIKLSNEKHDKKYNYDKTIYINPHSKIIVTCKIHGDFKISANNHLRGSKCPKCPKCAGRIYTTENFIEKSKLIYKNKYLYNNSKFISIKNKIIITCKIHGDWETTVEFFLKGNGCLKCNKENNKKNNSKKHYKNFIKKAKNIYKDFYEYNKVKYINSVIPVIITCPRHGDFQIRPNNFLNGKKCKYCSYEQRKIKQRKTNKQFIKECIKINNNFDYSLVEYRGAKNKIKIICKKHGIFEISPTNFLSGKSCSKCNSSNGENKIREFLKSKNIEFKEQKSFKDCKLQKKLRFDFFILDKNICIEFHGKQHYEFSLFFHKNMKDFKMQIKRDNIKKNFLKNKNIKFIEIPYFEINNIEKILSNKLNLNEN